jgi:hypothetical protein
VFEDGEEGEGRKDREGIGRTVRASEPDSGCPQVSYESISSVESRASGREEFKSWFNFDNSLCSLQLSLRRTPTAVQHSELSQHTPLSLAASLDSQAATSRRDSSSSVGAV